MNREKHASTLKPIAVTRKLNSAKNTIKKHKNNKKTIKKLCEVKTL